MACPAGRDMPACMTCRRPTLRFHGRHSTTVPWPATCAVIGTRRFTPASASTQRRRRVRRRREAHPSLARGIWVSRLDAWIWVSRNAGLDWLMLHLGMRYRASSRCREFVEACGCLICRTGNAGLVETNVMFLELGNCMEEPWKRMVSRLNLWGSASACGDCGSRGDVWENGAGVWGRPRGCVGTAGMEGAACVWGPLACMGNGNPMKARNMKAGCGLRTLCIFGNIGGTAPRYVVALPTEAMPENVAVAPPAGSRDIRFLSQRSPAAGRALLARTGGLEDPGCQPRLMTGSRIGAWADRL